MTEDIQIHGDKLRQLREERGWDWGQLARLSSLSVAQVQALESGSVACFYTVAIKNNAARKVAKVLGVPESEVITVLEIIQPAEAAELMPAEAVVVQKSMPSSLPTSTWLGYGVMSLGLVMAWVGFQIHQSSTAARPGGFMAATSAAKPVTEEPPPVIAQTVAAPSSTVTPAPAPATDTTVAVAQVSPSPSPVPSATPSSVATGTVTRPPSKEVEMAPASLNEETACAFEGNNTALEASHPTKSGEKVSLMFHKAGLLCVQDSTGKVWKEELKPWVGRTFMGKAPWKLYSPVLTQADVYFQGEKIKVGGVSTQAITLTGKPFSQ